MSIRWSSSKRAKNPVSCTSKAELEVVVEKKIAKRLWMTQLSQLTVKR